MKKISITTLCLALGAVAAAVSAQSKTVAPFEVPPLVEPANAEHHVGKVIWVDLVTPDLAGAKRFYSGLFGWTFRDIPSGAANYAIALLDGRPVAGLFQRTLPPGEHKRPAWLAFIAVRDVDATMQTALAHGAKVVFEPRNYPQRGRQATFADPEGAVFAVLASGSGDPPDFLAAPGEWLWTSLHVQDPDKDAAFYQTLFGFDVFDVPSDDSREHLILSTDNLARASVNSLPDESPRRHAHWLNFVRVANAASATARVVALGGRVVVEPHMDRQGGNVAVVADPSGAQFGLMEWSSIESKKEPK
jgi:uncharacterized protein